MKRNLVSLLLTAALCAALAAPAAALTSADISGGSPSGIAADGDALLITDTFNKVVWRIEDETVSRFAGQISVPGLDGEPVGKYEDGTLDTALFMEPWDIVPFLDGWAVSDAAANVIRYLDDSGVRTAAGSGKTGKANGVGSQVSFHRPTGLAVGPDGELYIADTGNGSIRKMDTKGKVTTVLTGLADPTGLCWADGALYVAETGRSRILRVTGGRMEVLAGESEYLGDGEYEGGYVDGPVAKARFDHPQGVAVGADGAVYIADTGNHAVRRLLDGRVTTLACAGQNPQAPVQPRGLLLQEDTLLVTDPFARELLALSIAPVSYRDVPAGAWYEETVSQATRRGLTCGTGNGNFSPNVPVSRASLVVMLSRLHQGTDGSAVIDGNYTFADVAEDAWYASSARWAGDRGILWEENDTLRPSAGVSRAEAVRLLYRYTASAGYDTSARADLSRFSDADGGDDALSWAVAEGILGGVGDGYLLPEKTATRAEILRILLNFMDVLGI